MRITGGELKGRRIVAPQGRATRPTTDRVREALFNILSHSGHAPALPGARVMDVFAGSGSLGLEALSRGADFALFVEESARAGGAIRANIKALGLDEKAGVWRRDAVRLGRRETMAPFDLAFLDPPYGRALGEAALAALADGGWLRPGALAVLEESARAAPAIPAAFRESDVRTYGDTAIYFLIFGGDAGNSPRGE